MVTDTQKEAILKEARGILDSFAKELAYVKTSHLSRKTNHSGMRTEGKGMRCEEDFRARMFENAPKTGNDCIIAEKATW